MMPNSNRIHSNNCHLVVAVEDEARQAKACCHSRKTYIGIAFHRVMEVILSLRGIVLVTNLCEVDIE